MNLFEQLKYRVDLIEDEYLPDEVKSILNIPAFRKFTTRKSKRPQKYYNRIIKYIGLMYDPKSTYPIEFLDLSLRKMQVAKACNFTKHGERGQKFRQEYQTFMDLDTDDSKILILAFLKDIHYSVWTEIQTTEQELWELTQLRWEKITTSKTKTSKSRKKGEEGETSTYDVDVEDKEIFENIIKKEKLMEASRKRREYLKELYEEMFADNVDVKEAFRDVPISPENAMSFV